MKIKTCLKLTSSLVAVGTALGGTAALAQTANGWTGGSSFYYSCPDGTGGTTTCADQGNNSWSDSANWSDGLPSAGDDINIGHSTYQSGVSPRPTQHDSVLINGATSAQAGRLTIGFSGGRTDSGSAAAGELINEGSLTVVNGIVVGSSGSADLLNDGDLSITNGSLVVGRGAQGSVNIGSGASTTINEHLVVGESSAGDLTAESDIAVGGNTTIGQLTNSDGTLTLANGADLTIGGTLTVGENGAGQLIVQDGSVVATTGAVGAGLGSTSTGNMISVEGEMLNGSTLTLGQFGTAVLDVTEDGRVETTGRVTLGSGADSSGTVSNTGTIDNNAGLVVGDHGRGIVFTTGDSATTNTTGSAVLGSDELGVGVVAVSLGGEMNTSGRFDIGDEGQGYLLVNSGGQANNAEATIGRKDSGRGYVLVTGTDSLWNSQNSLTLADEAGSQGLLVINDDGTVRIDEGDGTLVIAAEAGSTGILNVGAMSPLGNDYGIDAEVSAFIGGSDNDDTAVGAGTLDAAYVQFGEGQGVVNFKTTESEADDYRFAAGFVGDGVVNHFAGFTVLDGDSTGFGGSTNVVGGTLVANNVLAGNAIVAADGVLRVGHGGTTGDVVNGILSDGLIEFNRSDAYEFDSVIAGEGDVAQIGSGTTILSAANAYTGSTTIANGTLQVGNGGTTGSIDTTSNVSIGTDGTLAFKRSDLVVFDRELTGTGAIEQIGSGATVLTADNGGFTGETIIDAGTLAVTDILGGSVDVNDAGTLAGIGTVGTTVAHDGGTIAPGLGNIGTLGIDGDLSQLANSTYQAEVLSSGEADRILVDGEATLEDGAILDVTKLDRDRYDLDRRYTVLTATDGVSGAYDLTGETFVSTFYRVEDQYDANNAYLKVNQSRQFQDAALTDNQTAAATAAQELKGQSEHLPGFETTGRTSNELFRAIAYLPTDEFAQFAFDQISGEIYASTTIGLIEQSRFVRDATGQRIRDAFDGVGASNEIDVTDGLSFWGEGFGSWSEIDEDGNAGAFSHNTGGFVLGADVPLSDAFRIGALAGYSHSGFSADGRNSSANSDNIDIGLYGGGQIDNFGFRVGANYTWHNVSTDRNVNIPGFSESLSSAYDARTTQVYGDIGYTVDLGRVSFEPFLGLAHVSVDRDGYNESGGVAALAGSSNVVDATFATLGLRGSATVSTGDMPLKASGMIGWRHAFDALTPTATNAFTAGSPFTVTGIPLAQDVAIVEGGLEAMLTNDLSLGVSYSGQFGGGISDHGLRGNLNWSF